MANEMLVSKEELAQRIAAKSAVESGTDCCVWTGPTDEKGYGYINIKGKTKRAHRVAWVSANGPIPQGLVVMHLCDNPSCVRLDHLALGTQRANMQDMRLKRRAAGYPVHNTACVNGHPITPETTYTDKRGHHQCIICCRLRQAERRRNDPHRAWLATETVQAIAGALQSGDSQRKIAKRFHVSQWTVWNISRGGWKGSKKLWSAEGWAPLHSQEAIG